MCDFSTTLRCKIERKGRWGKQRMCSKVETVFWVRMLLLFCNACSKNGDLLLWDRGEIFFATAKYPLLQKKRG